MRALILQMRGHDDTAWVVEQKQYLMYTGLPASQVTFVDLYNQPDLDPAHLLAYDALFVGGVSRDKGIELEWPEQLFPFIHNLRAILQLAIGKKIPTMLSCGGFVIAGDMLGAKTLCKPVDFELGVYALHKTESAKSDIFLGPVSDQLPMVAGHVKYLAETPPGTTLLLYTNEYADRVPVHAFKVTGAPFYAFQGHPEISCAELSERVKPMLYRKQYFPKRKGNKEDEKYGYNEEAYRAFCSLKTDTSEAQGLLRRFVNLIGEGAFEE